MQVTGINFIYEDVNLNSHRCITFGLTDFAFRRQTAVRRATLKKEVDEVHQGTQHQLEDIQSSIVGLTDTVDGMKELLSGLYRTLDQKDQLAAEVIAKLTHLIKELQQLSKTRSTPRILRSKTIQERTQR
ncbi:hypothetical protein BGX27_005291 [Mortierella sp. AM989]|nr:hypothetical protein BGX27_005291 [Mortierella sp. AM989]